VGELNSAVCPAMTGSPDAATIGADPDGAPCAVTAFLAATDGPEFFAGVALAALFAAEPPAVEAFLTGVPAPLFTGPLFAGPLFLAGPALAAPVLFAAPVLLAAVAGALLAAEEAVFAEADPPGVAVLAGGLLFAAGAA
jgi:hypothetical protein